MKKIVLSFILCIVMTAMNAQEFTLKNMFLTFTSGTPKNPSVMTSESIFGMQWQLKTDGPNGTSTFNTSLQIGTTTNGVSTACFESLGTFEHIKAIKVVASIQNSYTLSVKCGKEESVYSGNEPESDEVQHFFPVKNSVGKVSVTITFPKFLKKQMYIKSIEVITELKDKENLDNMLRKNQTVSYSVSRTFSKDYWNTLCLPFDVEESQVQELFGTTHRLRSFTRKVDANSTMIFAEAKEIKAGVPYLLKPAKTVENPVFTNVIYTNATPTVVSDPTGAFCFVGAFNPTELQTDGTELFLGNGDKLYKPSSSHNRMNGMRAFFRIKKNSNALSSGKYAIRFDDETTAIMDILPELKSHNSCTYNLQGMIVDDSQPLPPGIYVKNGTKICVCK